MATKKPKKDSGKYPPYSQYAFRASEADIASIQHEIESLYERFNKGRDPKAPQGRRAVKYGDIALEALRIGIAALQKRPKWSFDRD